MSILSYFKPSSMPPSPSDTGIGVVATKEANEAVRKGIDRGASANVVSKKCKAYTAFSDETREDIGRYAAENGNAAALKKFCSDISDRGESTVRLFKKRYLEEVRKVPRGERVDKIMSCKCGRPLELGKELDNDVQKYVKALRKAGTPINTAVILAAVEGIITAKDQALLDSNGGHIQLNKSWAKSLMARMNLVKR